MYICISLRFSDGEVLPYRQPYCTDIPRASPPVTNAALSTAFQADQHLSTDWSDMPTPTSRYSLPAGHLLLLSTLLRFGFYDNIDNRDNGLIVNSMLSVDNNKNNFYQPKGWLPLEIF